MAQRIILFLLIIFSGFSTSHAEQVQTYKLYNPLDTVDYFDLNGNLNNIRTIVNGSLDNDNAATSRGFRFIEILSQLPASGNQGRTVYDQLNNTLCFDTGSAFQCAPVLDNTSISTGAIIYYTGTAWTDNVPGTLSQVLTEGSNTVPTWASTISVDRVTSTDAFITTLNSTNIKIGTANQGDIYYDDGSGYLIRLTPGTADYFLKTNGAGANPSYASTGFTTATTGTFTDSFTLTLTANKTYRVVLEYVNDANTSVMEAYFNSESATSDNEWAAVGRTSAGTAIDSNDLDDSGIEIVGGQVVAAYRRVFSDIIINTRGDDDSAASESIGFIQGKTSISGADEAAAIYIDFSGTYNENNSDDPDPVTSITFTLDSSVTSGRYFFWTFSDT